MKQRHTRTGAARSAPWLGALAGALAASTWAVTPTTSSAAATEPSLMPQPLAQMVPGPEGLKVGERVVAGDTIWFLAGRSDYRMNIWQLRNGVPRQITFAADGVSDPDDLVVIGKKVYFTSEAGDPYTRHLYSATATPHSATRLSRVNVAPTPGLARWRNKLFFRAGADEETAALWVHDGNTTHRVRSLPGRGDVQLASVPNRAQGMVFQGPKCTWWITDGTRAGTRQLAPPTCGRYGLGEILYSGSRWYLTAPAGSGTDTMVVSDGTPQGTHTVPGFPRKTQITRLHPRPGGRALFTQRDDLWTTDGTRAGTRRVPGHPGVATAGSPVATIDAGTVLERSEEFSSRYALLNPRTLAVRELSTCATTTRRGVIAGGEAASGWRYFTALRTPNSGAEPWVVDARGVGRVADIVPGKASSLPDIVAVVKGYVYLLATTKNRGQEWWRIPVNAPAVKPKDPPTVTRVCDPGLRGPDLIHARKPRTGFTVRAWARQPVTVTVAARGAWPSAPAKAGIRKVTKKMPALKAGTFRLTASKALTAQIFRGIKIWRNTKNLELKIDREVRIEVTVTFTTADGKKSVKRHTIMVH